MIAKGERVPVLRSGESSLFRAIFEHSHLLVAYLDRELRFVRVNRTYAAADGREPEDFVGKGHFELYPHIQNERIFRRVLETGVSHFEGAKPFQYAHVPDRGISYWDWTLVPVLEEENPTVPAGLILTLVDVTERVRSIEQLHRLSEQREALLHEVHHRVKNNLQVVASLLSLQEPQISDEAAREALRDSRRRVRAIGLVHDRLSASERVAGVSLADFCRSLTRELIEAFAWRGKPQLTFAVDETIQLSPPRTTPVVLILNELITNALTHAFPEGEPGSLEVGAARLADGRVELWVQDDGDGLSADFDWEHVRTLGLRLVRRLAEQVGGELLVNPASPTRFAVRFGLLGSTTPSV